TVPNDLDPSDRPAALEQLGVSGAANSRLVSLTQEYVTSERDTALLSAPGPGPCSQSAAGGLPPRAGVDERSGRFHCRGVVLVQVAH
ncbi:hypothetical protein ABZ891_36845, partial [Streptomyces sp. NPDC047023]